MGDLGDRRRWRVGQRWVPLPALACCLALLAPLTATASAAPVARPAAARPAAAVDADGGVLPYGAAGGHGDLSGVALAKPVVGMASTPDGGGYWLVAADGGVFAYGDAAFHGSAGGLPLAAPVVGMASTPDGGGYWLVAADGGVFAYGDAAFHGSAGGLPLTRPVVGMAADAATGGYWLAASDGGIFAYGAPFLGSEGGAPLARPVTGMAATASGSGYWLVATDGGVFAFGAAPYEGSSGASPPQHLVVGMAADPAGPGYWLVEGADLPLAGKVVVLDPGHDGGNASDPAFIDAPIWNGREEESCDTVGAETASGYPESQFTFNVATDLVPMLQAQGATVIVTRPNNTGVGPCVTTRTAIGNDAHADAALSIHADGGPVGGRGYAILTPVADGPNDGVIGSSDALGAALRDQFGLATGTGVSTYDGVDGIQPRDDLAGVNLTTVPKVFIECANMANPSDAVLTESAAWQARAAQGIDAGLVSFLIGG